MNRDLNNLLFLLNMSTMSCLNINDDQLCDNNKKRKLLKILGSYMWSDQDLTDAIFHYGNHGIVVDKPFPFKKFRLSRKLKSHE